MLAVSTGKFGRVSCVYPSCNDSSIPIELFNVHLARCRRLWTGPMVACDYNGAHAIPTPEVNYRSVTCPERRFGEVLGAWEDGVEFVVLFISGDCGEKPFSSGTSRRDVGKPFASSSLLFALELLFVDGERSKSNRGRAWRGKQYPKRRNVGPSLLQKQFERVRIDDGMKPQCSKEEECAECFVW